MVEQRMSIGRMEEAINVFGSFDENIRLIESELHVAVTNRDGELKITGEAENVLLAARALKALLALSAKDVYKRQRLKRWHGSMALPIPQYGCGWTG